jgi:hypothetical protein
MSSASSHPLKIAKYSLGVGDRFAHQAAAQLQACIQAQKSGFDIVPVWNKSNREHTIIGSRPESVSAAAKAAVQKLGWNKTFHVDADHINLKTVDTFLAVSDYYTLDVADSIAKPADESEIARFVDKHQELQKSITLAGLTQPLSMSKADVTRIAKKYLFAAKDAGNIYRHIEKAKGKNNFITEVSMDETDLPQTPDELLVILAALADEGVPVQAIAPKFTGRFNKGVDYVGDVRQFEAEFKADVAAIAHAVQTYGLPQDLKLSVHSGSDKFSIYPAIHRVLEESGAGVHIKTAGTTWLEELIGLAEAGGQGLALAKDIYAQAFVHRQELCGPYATVIDIDPSKLPPPEEVSKWTSEQYTNALRHDQSCRQYNPSFRQLLHVGYKIASQIGPRYVGMLKECEPSISHNVTTNLFDRHIKPIFLGVPTFVAAQ